MSDSDGTDFSTRAPTARRTWLPVATSCRARHEMSPLPEAPVSVEPIWCRKPLGKATGCSGPFRGERGETG
jgi:hypothetical protein